MRERDCRGFTLIELLIVIGLAAIVLAMALPSFVDSMRSNRVATTTNLTLATLSYARSEALRSRSTATVCPRGAGDASCGSDWGWGMLVWTDDNRNERLDAIEVRRLVEPTQGTLIAAGFDAVAFDQRGRSTATAARQFALKPDTCKSGSANVRTVSVSLTGQIDMQRGQCP